MPEANLSYFGRQRNHPKWIGGQIVKLMASRTSSPPQATPSSEPMLTMDLENHAAVAFQCEDHERLPIISHRVYRSLQHSALLMNEPTPQCKRGPRIASPFPGFNTGDDGLSHAVPAQYNKPWRAYLRCSGWERV